MPVDKAPVENADLVFERLNLEDEGHEAGAHKLWNTMVRTVCDDANQGFHSSAPDGSDNAELGEMGSDRVCGRSQLPDKEMPRPVQHQARLLVRRLDRHKSTRT